MMAKKHFGLAALAGTFLAGASVLAYAQSGATGGGAAGGGAGGGAPPAATAPAGGGAGAGASGGASGGGSAGAPAARDSAPSTTTQSQSGQSGQGGTAPARTGQSESRPQGNSTQSGAAGSGSNTGAAAPGASQDSGNRAASGNANVNLTSQQKTEIRNTVIKSGNAPRVTNVNFKVNVGVAVPADVRFAPLPATIVEIHPAWRGYSYFVYQEEIIVIDPRTRQIVAVLVV
jgi:hypothetical protein